MVLLKSDNNINVEVFCFDLIMFITKLIKIWRIYQKS